MDYKPAHTLVGHTDPKVLGEKVRVGSSQYRFPPTIILHERTPNREYRESWRRNYPTQVRPVEIDASVGRIVHQRTTSPASAGVLERIILVYNYGELGVVGKERRGREWRYWATDPLGRVACPKGTWPGFA